jgi:MGT family glycosyltransferase
MKKQRNVLVVTIDGGGNLPPVLGIAQDLMENGYRVSVLTEPCMEETIRDYGFNFIPFKRHFTRTDRKEDIFKDWNVSPIKNPVLDNIVLGPARIVTEETVNAIDQSGAELLVADCLLPTALNAAEARKIPGVLAFHMPEYFPGPNRPPGLFGLKPGKGLVTRLRDKLVSRLFINKMNNFLPVVNETRARYNLPALKQASDLIHQADLRLIQTLERFDFPIEPRPSNVRYTGPVLHDPDWTSSWSNPWPADDPRPLVVISLSSTFQNQQAAIQSSIDALRDQGIRGLVTLGPAMKKDAFSVPENVILVDSAPHSQVFPMADLVITHAGHGTIMRALSHGLPLVCLPMGRDQDDNAIKVEHHGCGLALSAKASPGKIRKAVQKILAEDSFRNAAGKLKRDIEAIDQTALTINEIEGVLGPEMSNTEQMKEATISAA